MADVVSAAVRSRMMAGIRGRDTAPEMLIRRALHRAGFRYRLHGRDLPGRPDIVLPKYRAVIEVRGCFWHLHDCELFKWPTTRTDFWREKITANRARDERVRHELREAGWRLLEIWECALKGPHRLEAAVLAARVVAWVQGRSRTSNLGGRARRRRS